MSDEKKEADREAGRNCDDAPRESRSCRDRERMFECCGADMSGMMAGSPCGSFMRRHPFVTTVILAAAGLALLAVPTGAILGIIAFVRTL